jgi:hypothetical protein
MPLMLQGHSAWIKISRSTSGCGSDNTATCNSQITFSHQLAEKSSRLQQQCQAKLSPVKTARSRLDKKRYSLPTV